MKVSLQLTLGELILKLETVNDKTLPLFFDVGKYHPIDVDSWRGSYCELAINYDDGDDVVSVDKFLSMLRSTIGRTFEGYKGGDFLMGKITPVWVANYGRAKGFRPKADTAVVNVKESSMAVKIITKSLAY